MDMEEIHWIPALVKVEQVPLERCSNGLFVDADGRIVRIVTFSNADHCITIEAVNQDGERTTRKFDADQDQPPSMLWRVIDI